MPPAPASSQLPPHLLFPPNRAGAAEAARLLTAGKLVLLPTETIYGIAVNLHSPEARHAARLLKTRDAHPSENTPHSPWVIHVARPEDLLSWVPHVSPVGRRIILKSLPGPVALQIKLNAADRAAVALRLGEAAAETLVDDAITLRCPDLSSTQDVLSAVNVPVAIIGAGTPARPGIFEIADVPPSLFTDTPEGPGIAAALDAGPTRYRKSSTLVRLEGEKYTIVRQGVIDERILDRFSEFMVLFICSGNTCRSPMASALASRIIADNLKIQPKELFLRKIAVQSAGVHAARGMRATLEAVEAVKELGGDLSSHLSQPATVDLLRRADVIYTMTTVHREEVLELLPGAERKTFQLDPEGDVSDPIGSSFSVYQQVASRLSAILRRRLAELSI